MLFLVRKIVNTFFVKNASCTKNYRKIICTLVLVDHDMNCFLHRLINDKINYHLIG